MPVSLGHAWTSIIFMFRKNYPWPYIFVRTMHYILQEVYKYQIHRIHYHLHDRKNTPRRMFRNIIVVKYQAYLKWKR